MSRTSLKALSAVALLFTAFHASAQTQFTLSGKINDKADAPLMFRYVNANGKNVTDSAVVQNGTFVLKGNIDKASLARLWVPKTSSTFKAGEIGNEIRFFIEPGNINAVGDYANLSGMKITGSPSQKEYAVYDTQYKEYIHVCEPLENEFLTLQGQYHKMLKTNDDDPRLKPIDKKMDSLNSIMVTAWNRISTQFITTHPDSYVSAYALNERKTRLAVSKVTRYYNNLTARAQDCQDAKQVKKFLDNINANSIGKPAKNFTAVDVNGKSITLAAFKGRYVILDFWATWCGPCRASTPHLMELYNKHHKAGLDVIAIASDDDAQAEWKRAIKKDKIGAWVNILSGYDPKIDEEKATDISTKYGVDVMPTKILIDKNGMIVGRYSGSDEDKAMGKKLEEIFN